MMKQKSLLEIKLKPNKNQKKGNKFGAIKTTYNGVIYDSKKESEYAYKLDLLRKANGNDRVIEVERQIKYSVDVEGKHICNYYLDFKVTYPNRVEHVDIKGLKSGASYQIFRLKKKLIEALYKIEIIEI